jgi:hypothetical protein
MNKGIRIAVAAVCVIAFVAVLLLALDRCQVVPLVRTPTPTPTEGELAAAAVGEEYVAYRPTEVECDELVDGGESESCVWPSSIELMTQAEWEELLPQTEFYLIGLSGRSDIPEYDNSFRQRLIAWYRGEYYTGEDSGRLLIDNGVSTILDGQQELVAKAFAVMTLPNHLDADVAFTDWMEVDWHGRTGPLDQGLVAWTELQGLEISWGFRFRDGWLEEVRSGGASESGLGDYIDVHYDQLPWPAAFDYRFTAPGE